MGVLGFTPFLQKHCPEVIKVLHDRLRSLRGKTVVLDGTLITQRLHYANAPQQYKHVLGWYRIMREMKDCGVSAICVFDGKERNLAKGSELQRRREVRRVGVARSVAENERSLRLKQLSGLLKAIEAVPRDDRRRASRKLRKLIGSEKEGQSSTLPALADLKELDEALTGFEDGGGTSYGTHVDPEEMAEFVQLREQYLEIGARPASMDSGGPSTVQCSPERIQEDDFDFDVLGMPAYTAGEMDLDLELHLLSLDQDTFGQLNQEDRDVSATLADLYNQYRASLPSLSTPITDASEARSGPLANVPSSSTPIVNATDPEAVADVASSQPLSDDVHTEVEVVLSRRQQELTAEEGQIWDMIVESVEGDVLRSLHSDAGTRAVNVAVDKLAVRSGTIAKSYERFTNPPTAATFRHCRVLLRAMGVPVLMTQGPFEAEALASSIVRNGLADYVASEDTDVLVYEAPMIRNLTSRRNPLVVISGSDVRHVLQLNRPRYIDFALLLGTDFSRRLKHVGPTRALQFIRKHGSIEEVVVKESKYLPRRSRDRYIEQVELARMVFDTLPSVPDKRSLEPGVYDKEKVTRILQKYGLGQMLDEADHAQPESHDDALSGNYFNDDPHPDLLQPQLSTLHTPSF